MTSDNEWTAKQPIVNINYLTIYDSSFKFKTHLLAMKSPASDPVSSKVFISFVGSSTL